MISKNTQGECHRQRGCPGAKENFVSLVLGKDIKNHKDLMAAKRNAARKLNVKILQNSDIIFGYKKLVKENKIKANPSLEAILRKRAVRTMSGIAPVAVLTKPFPCPGKCAYCPTEKNVPQSYLSNEPAVMRAIRCGYDPYKQVEYRLRALLANGHEPTKIELIVIGGTWSVLPEKYKYWYVANLFAAANKFRDKGQGASGKYKQSMKLDDLKKVLAREQKKNETAKYKIIGLTLETRPDYINEKELIQMREFGCTRVELGVQAIDDKILKLNKRGHDVAEVAKATKALRDFGFKITYHLMPGLPGASAKKDLKMFETLFNDERFQPDQIKFYPTVVTKGSLLYKWWKRGLYKPYSDKTLENLIIACKKLVPPYVRIIRLIRDIPEESIIAGNKITNLRQVMHDKGVECGCIRCREAKEVRSKKLKVRIINYRASGGEEYFISFEDFGIKKLFGFCRLRVGSEVIIRELHVYGELVSVGGDSKTQHSGLGKRLIQEAEKIALRSKVKEIKIISGVGVRGYYKKLGYRLKNTYMVKRLTK